MNQVIATSFALAVALILWVFGRKPSQIVSSKVNVDFSKKHNESSLVIKNDQIPQKQKSPQDSKIIESSSIKLRTPQESVKLKKILRKLIEGGPKERLEAVLLAEPLNTPEAIGILRRGLKDYDSMIVIAAAKAIQKHKEVGKYQADELSPPRNISLMR